MKDLHIEKDDFKDMKLDVKVEVTTEAYCMCDECQQEKVAQNKALTAYVNTVLK